MCHPMIKQSTSQKSKRTSNLKKKEEKSILNCFSFLNRLWHKVSQAIRSSNESRVAEEKSKIEMRQREKEADRKLNQIEYYPKLFIKSGNEWIYKYLEYISQIKRNIH